MNKKRGLFFLLAGVISSVMVSAPKIVEQLQEKRTKLLHMWHCATEPGKYRCSKEETIRSRGWIFGLPIAVVVGAFAAVGLGTKAKEIRKRRVYEKMVDVEEISKRYRRIAQIERPLKGWQTELTQAQKEEIAKLKEEIKALEKGQPLPSKPGVPLQEMLKKTGIYEGPSAGPVFEVQ